MLRKYIAIMTVSSVFILGILLTTTTPLSTGPLGILAFFVFMYTTALGVLTFFIQGISYFVPKLVPIRNKRWRTKEISFRQSYYYASVAALAPVMLVAMVSVGEIGVYQVLLILVFVVTAWLYVSSRTS